MTERKHSELPWIVRRTSVKMVLEGNFHQITTSDDFPPAFVPAWDAPKAGQLDGTEEALANAAFIVTACNAHYDLVEAMEEMISKLEIAARLECS